MVSAITVILPPGVDFPIVVPDSPPIVISSQDTDGDGFTDSVKVMLDKDTGVTLEEETRRLPPATSLAQVHIVKPQAASPTRQNASTAGPPPLDPKGERIAIHTASGAKREFMVSASVGESGSGLDLLIATVFRTPLPTCVESVHIKEVNGPIDITIAPRCGWTATYAELDVPSSAPSGSTTYFIKLYPPY